MSAHILISCWLRASMRPVLSPVLSPQWAGKRQHPVRGLASGDPLAVGDSERIPIGIGGQWGASALTPAKLCLISTSFGLLAILWAKKSNRYRCSLLSTVYGFVLSVCLSESGLECRFGALETLGEHRTSIWRIEGIEWQPSLTAIVVFASVCFQSLHSLHSHRL